MLAFLCRQLVEDQALLEELNPELVSRGFEQVPLKGMSVADNITALRSHVKRSRAFLGG